jgi:hypothetical protein
MKECPHCGSFETAQTTHIDDSGQAEFYCYECGEYFMAICGDAARSIIGCPVVSHAPSDDKAHVGNTIRHITRTVFDDDVLQVIMEDYGSEEAKTIFSMLAVG